MSRTRVEILAQNVDIESTLALKDGSTTRLYIDSSGNLGINTATPAARLDVDGNIAVSGTVDGRDIAVDGAKLDLIEAGATADQTAAEIKTAYESNANTNAFTDAEKTKLSGIATGAEVNVNADWSATTGDAVILNKPTIPTDNAQLTNGAGYITSFDITTQTDSKYLRSDVADTYTELYTPGSTNSASFKTSGSWGTFHNTSVGYIQFGPANTSHAHIYTDRPDFYFNAPLKINGGNVWHSLNDGSGSGLDADTLDGQQGSYYLDYNNLTNVPAGSSNADTLDNLDSTQFLRSDATDTASGQITLTYGDQSLISQHNGTSSAWRGRILVKNSSADKASFLGTYAGIAGVFSHNNALTAWADLYVNTVDGSGGGTVRMPSSVLVNGSQVWHAGNDGSGSGLDADLWDGNQFSSYLNQAVLTTSGPTFANVYNNGWFRNNASATGLYSQANNAHFYSPGTSHWHINGSSTASGALIFYSAFNGSQGNATNRKGYVYWDSSGFGLLSQDGSWAYRHNNTYADIFGTIRQDGSNTVWHAGNDGSGSGLDADTLHGGHWTSGVSPTFNVLSFSGVGGNSGNGVQSYSIYQEGGAWSSPYPDLVIGYHTGIKIGGYYAYNGTRFYSDAPGRSGAAEIFSVGNGDTNVRVTNNLYIGGYTAWHAGNDGSGSGLDADNLDGYTWDTYGKNIRGYEIYADSWFRNYNSGLGLYNQATGQHFYSDDDDYWNIAGGTSANGLRFRDEHGGTIRGYVYANNSNQIGFLNSSASWSFKCDNSGNVTATGNVTAYSDIRLKEDIEVIPDALAKVSQLRGIIYTRTDTSERQTGVIAQEVEKVLPEAVSESENYKSVAYGNMVGLLIEAVKELTARVEELEEQLRTK